MSEDWRKSAKCSGMGFALFVPTGRGGSMKRALAVCHGRDGQSACPVMTECKAFGEENNLFGCWGGEIRSQREFMKIQDARPSRVAS